LPSPTHAVEALLFDMGGVVIDIDFDLALRSWGEHSRLSIDEMRSRSVMDAAYEQHERGELDASEYFQHLRTVFELDGNDEDIARGWNSIYVGDIAETVRDILSVRDRLPCYAFTNSNTTHQISWTAAYPEVVAAFHRIFVSSELGLRKPERAAFDAIADATGTRSAATLFFDDTTENVVGALAAGLQAVHVRSPSDVRDALIGIGVL